MLEVLDRIRSRQAAEAHRRQVTELKGKDLARYLGYLGEDLRNMEAYLGHPIDELERLAFEEGRRQRQLELRAVELDRAVRGQCKPAPWMRS